MIRAILLMALVSCTQPTSPPYCPVNTPVFCHRDGVCTYDGEECRELVACEVVCSADGTACTDECADGQPTGVDGGCYCEAP